MPTNPDYSQQLPVKIPPDAIKALQEIHEETRIPISELVRDKLKELFAEHGKDPELLNVKRGGYRPKKE